MEEKIKICPNGFHVNTLDNECSCNEKLNEKNNSCEIMSKGGNFDD